MPFPTNMEQNFNQLSQALKSDEFSPDEHNDEKYEIQNENEYINSDSKQDEMKPIPASTFPDNVNDAAYDSFSSSYENFHSGELVANNEIRANGNMIIKQQASSSFTNDDKIIETDILIQDILDDIIQKVVVDSTTYLQNSDSKPNQTKRVSFAIENDSECSNPLKTVFESEILHVPTQNDNLLNIDDTETSESDQSNDESGTTDQSIISESLDDFVFKFHEMNVIESQFTGEKQGIIQVDIYDAKQYQMSQEYQNLKKLYRNATIQIKNMSTALNNQNKVILQSNHDRDELNQVINNFRQNFQKLFTMSNQMANEMKNLNQKCSQLESDNSQLTVDCTYLQKFNKQIQACSSQQLTYIKNLKANLETQKQENFSLIETIAKKETVVALNKVLKQQTDEKLATLETALQQKEWELIDIKSQIEKEKQTINTQHILNRETSVKEAYQRASQEILVCEQAKFETMLKDKNQEIQSYKNNIKQFESEIVRLEHDKLTMQENISQYKQRIESELRDIKQQYKWDIYMKDNQNELQDRNLQQIKLKLADNESEIKQLKLDKDSLSQQLFEQRTNSLSHTQELQLELYKLKQENQFSKDKIADMMSSFEKSENKYEQQLIDTQIIIDEQKQKIESLKDINRGKDIEIEELEKQLQRLESNESLLTDKLSQLQSSEFLWKTQTTQEVESKDKKLSKLMSKIEKLNKDETQLKQSIDQINNEKQLLEQQFNAQNEQLASVTQQNHKLNDQIAILNQHIASLRVENTQLSTKIQTYKSTIKSNDNDIEQLKNDLESILEMKQKLAKKFEVELQTMKQSMDNKSNIESAAKQHIESKMKQYSRMMQTDIEKIKSQFAHFNELTKVELQNMQRATKQNLQSFETNIVSKYQYKLAQQEKVTSTLQQQLLEDQTRKQNLASEITRLQFQINNFKNEQQSLLQTKDSIISQCKSEIEERKSIQIKFADLESEFEKWKLLAETEKTNLSLQIETLSIELNRLQNIIDDFEKAKQFKENNVKSVCTQHSMACNQCLIHCEKLKQQKSLSQSLKKQIDNDVKTITEQKQQIDSLELENDKLSEKIKQFEKDFNNIKSKFRKDSKRDKHEILQKNNRLHKQQTEIEKYKYELRNYEKLKATYETMREQLNQSSLLLSQSKNENNKLLKQLEKKTRHCNEIIETVQQRDETHEHSIKLKNEQIQKMKIQFYNHQKYAEKLSHCLIKQSKVIQSLTNALQQNISLRNKRYEAKIDAASTKLSQYENNIQCYKNEINDSKQVIKQQTLLIEDLNKNLAKMKQIETRLNEQEMSLSRENHIIKSETMRLNNQLQQETLNNDQLRMKIILLEKQIKDLNIENETELSDVLVQQSKKYNDLINEKEQTIFNLQQTIRKLHSDWNDELQKNESELHKLKNENNVLTNQKTIFADENQVLKQQIEENISDMKNKLDEIESINNKNQSLQEENNNMVTNIEQMSIKLKEMESYHQHADNTSRELVQHIEQYKSKLHESNNLNTLLQKKVDAALNQVNAATYQASLHARNSANESQSHKQKVIEMQTKIENLENKLKESNEIQKKYQLMEKNLRKEIGQLNSKLSSTNKEIGSTCNDYQLKLDAMKNVFETQKKQMIFLEQEKDELHNQLKQTKQDSADKHEQLMQKLQKQNNEIQALNQENKNLKENSEKLKSNNEKTVQSNENQKKLFEISQTQFSKLQQRNSLLVENVKLISSQTVVAKKLCDQHQAQLFLLQNANNELHQKLQATQVNAANYKTGMEQILHDINGKLAIELKKNHNQMAIIKQLKQQVFDLSNK